MDEFDQEDIQTIRQIITLWNGFNAIGSVVAIIKKMFWVVFLLFAIYLASTGHFELLNFIPH